MYINTQTLAYPYGIAELKRDNPQTSFPTHPTDALLMSYGVERVVPVSQPQHNPMTHTVIEAAPVNELGVWYQQWAVVELTPEQQQAAQDALVKTYTDAMDNLFNTTAQARRYDNRITCALRAGYAGPFQAEGQAFATWMDTCNALGYQIMGEVLAGQRALPTVEELLATLPAMVWPT